MGDLMRKWFDAGDGNHRAYTLSEDVDQATTVIAIASATVVALISVDYLAFGFHRLFFVSLAAKGTFCIFSILAMIKLRRSSRVAENDWIVFLWSLLLAAIVLGASLVRPNNFNNYAAPMWAVVGIYFLLPNRTSLKVVAALGFSIAKIFLSTLTEGIDMPVLIDGVVSLAAANTAGIVSSIQREKSQRRHHQNRILEERHRLQLMELATTDSLTGICNRRRFLELGETEFSRYKRYGDVFSFIVLDINKFKSINDTYGHPTGDVVLREFCAMLTSMKRSIDIVGRLGGDEIGMILPGTNYKNAKTAIQRIHQACRKLVIPIPSNSLHISFSAGITEVLPNDQSIDDLYRRADKRLYANKRKQEK